MIIRRDNEHSLFDRSDFHLRLLHRDRIPSPRRPQDVLDASGPWSCLVDAVQVALEARGVPPRALAVGRTLLFGVAVARHEGLAAMVTERIT